MVNDECDDIKCSTGTRKKCVRGTWSHHCRIINRNATTIRVCGFELRVILAAHALNIQICFRYVV